MYKTNALSEARFWKEFFKDLEHAKFRVLIQSPFLALKRIEFLQSQLTRLINSGVVICVVIQRPKYWSAKKEKLWPETVRRIEEVESLIALLEKLNIHVSIRTKVHEKIAVIDDFVLWEGSLNFMSHRDTSERMRRFVDRQEIGAAIVQYDNCRICAVNRKLVKTRYSAYNLAPALERYKRRAGESLRSLSARIGVSACRLSRVKNSQDQLSVDSMKKLAHVIEIESIAVPKVLLSQVAALIDRYERR